METALYGKIKESRERQELKVNWCEHTKHTLLFNYKNTILDKTKARIASVDEGKARINV